MNEKEVAELRRRFRQDKSGITHIRGCYVNENREVMAEFDQSLAMMGQEEGEKFLAILRKALSGTLSKNLVDLTFATEQVVHGEEHKLLMELRRSAIKNEEAVQAFFQRVIGTLNLEGNYLVMLVHDAYDVPYRSKDDEKQADASAEVFSYILCAVCPVKQTKPGLGYSVHENEFHNCHLDWVVSAPELGFLFPAFDDRSTNLYGALYYNRDTTENHAEFVDAVFKSGAPMPAAEQKETFQSLLGETLEDECCFEVVQAVQGELCGLIASHKESKVVEPLIISKSTVRQVLSSCGVSDSHMEAFETQFDDQFGTDADLSPRNLVDTKQLEIKTPDVTIRVNPERSDLVETRVLNGKKYILIRADEGVEVNGVSIHID